MNTKQRTAMIFVLLLSLALSSCTPGQLFGPTVNPTPTLTPTQTPIPPTSTNTPVPTAAGATSSGYIIPVQKCAPNCTYRDMVVGLIQTGYGIGWWDANTLNFEDTAKQLGVTFKFYNAEVKIENQVSAFHQFNQDPSVNVIILAPIDMTGHDTGYDDVLKEAAAKGKLVILEAHGLDTASSNYYTLIGSDNNAQGREAAVAMCDLLKNSKKKNVVEISGVPGGIGGDATIGRAMGFRGEMGDCGITITDSQTGNWNPQDSKAVMAAFLQKSTDIQGVFAQNDEEAIGAIQAIQEAGLVPGKDIMVVGIDASKDGFAALIAGTLGADIETNPLIAPQVYAAALKGMNGDATMPSFIPSQEGEFFASQGAGALKAILLTRQY